MVRKGKSTDEAVQRDQYIGYRVRVENASKGKRKKLLGTVESWNAREKGYRIVLDDGSEVFSPLDETASHVTILEEAEAPLASAPEESSSRKRAKKTSDVQDKEVPIAVAGVKGKRATKSSDIQDKEDSIPVAGVKGKRATKSSDIQDKEDSIPVAGVRGKRASKSSDIQDKDDSIPVAGVKGKRATKSSKAKQDDEDVSNPDTSSAADPDGEPSATETPDTATADYDEAENKMTQAFRKIGIPLNLAFSINSTNRKVRIIVPSQGKAGLAPYEEFSWQKLLKTSLKSGVVKLPSHTIQVQEVRQIGQSTANKPAKSSAKAATVRLQARMQVLTRGGKDLNSKIALRMYNETPGRPSQDGSSEYMLMVYGSEAWKDDNDIIALLADMYEPFGVTKQDIHVLLDDSCSLMGGTNYNTFGQERRVDTVKLAAELSKTRKDIRQISTTGAVIVPTSTPKASPTIQKSGVLLFPLCKDLRGARLAVLKVLLEHSTCIVGKQ